MQSGWLPNISGCASGDGTAFVLPVRSETTLCLTADPDQCLHNMIEYKNCHKFGVEARVIN